MRFSFIFSTTLLDIVLDEEISLAGDIRLSIIAFFMSERVFTFKVEVTGAIIRGFLQVDVVKLLLLLEYQ